MPLVYADSSVLFAWFHPHDEFSGVVDRAVQESSPDFVYWPFLRFELKRPAGASTRAPRKPGQRP